VGGDFALQGEYFGSGAAWDWNCGYLGLQVVAQGDGRLEGVLLRGGLPGAGWDRSTRIRLSGTRRAAAARLEGEHYTALVTSDAAVIASRGRQLARLPKIHRISVTQGAVPPCGAHVLFDGRSAESFEDGTMTEDGLLKVGGLTKIPVGDFRLHLEFRTPYMPYARSQGRGNSGVYIQQRYEVQILDSFGTDGVANECGGLYKQRPPAVNMCLPPLSWQTYDIYFTAARWDARRKKVGSARITVLHNGEPIHDNYEIATKTGAGKAEGPEKRPILLQNHGNPVHFRNIWLQTFEPMAPRSALYCGGYSIGGGETVFEAWTCRDPCARICF
jgi:hypothetical protein